VLPLVLLGLLPAAAGAVAGTTERLVFVNDRDGDQEIYLGGRQLTNNDTADYAPVASPDGKRLAFVSVRDGDEEIVVLRTDLSGLRWLTRNRVSDSTPAWSPDGRWIAFASARSGRRELYVISARGGRARRVVRSELPWHESWSPAWSPDGKWLAFVSNRAGLLNLEIYAVRPDGTGLRRLTRTSGGIGVLGDDTMPDWSPDGRRIAFASNRHGRSELYLMNADGSDKQRLTWTSAVGELLPRWSADGARLIFGTGTRLFVMSLDGGRQRSLGRGWDADWG
jgi:TolB protein